MKTTLATLALIVCMAQPGMAGTIEYSFEGTILPRDAAIDPWEIGAAGKPFTISAIVDEEAVDIDPEVRGAFFSLTDAALVIDGTAATEFNDGTIWFREQNGRDSVNISSDDVRFNGFRDGFLTLAALPTSTFTFTNSAENPPIFAPEMTVLGSGAGTVASSYVTAVESGVVVTATPVPEPSTFALTLLAALGVGTTFRRGRTR